jgi:hypothetical protein
LFFPVLVEGFVSALLHNELARLVSFQKPSRGSLSEVTPWSRIFKKFTMAAFRSFFTLLALLSVKVLADCVSYGIDYANGGAYYIDGSSQQYFTFVTVFQGRSGYGRS